MTWQAAVGRGIDGFLGRGLDLICPPRCLLCRAETPHPAEPVRVCDACRRLLAADGPRCRLCGSLSADDGNCRVCRGQWRSWDGIVVLGGYSDELRSAVLAAKRPTGALVVAGLATLLLERHRQTVAAWNPEVVVPVPMHWTRRLARGSSAAEGLAERLASGLGLPCRSQLRRVRATRMQNELHPADRHANVRGVFRSAAAAGRRVLLVDDVTTTGATLAECRAALVTAGASAVFAAVVARADRGDTGTD